MPHNSANTEGEAAAAGVAAGADERMEDEEPVRASGPAQRHTKEELLAMFREFLKDHDLGTFKPDSQELTKIYSLFESFIEILPRKVGALTKETLEKLFKDPKLLNGLTVEELSEGFARRKGKSYNDVRSGKYVVYILGILARFNCCVQNQENIVFDYLTRLDEHIKLKNIKRRNAGEKYLYREKSKRPREDEDNSSDNHRSKKQKTGVANANSNSSNSQPAFALPASLPSSSHPAASHVRSSSSGMSHFTAGSSSAPRVSGLWSSSSPYYSNSSLSSAWYSSSASVPVGVPPALPSQGSNWPFSHSSSMCFTNSTSHALMTPASSSSLPASFFTVSSSSSSQPLQSSVTPASSSRLLAWPPQPPVLPRSSSVSNQHLLSSGGIHQTLWAQPGSDRHLSASAPAAQDQSSSDLDSWVQFFGNSSGEQG